MSEILRGSLATAVSGISQEEAEVCLEQIFERSTADNIQCNLAKFCVQLEAFPDFTVSNHVTCATKESPGRSWYGEIGKIMWQKYKCTEFDQAHVEIIAVCQNTDVDIWGPVGDFNDGE